MLDKRQARSSFSKMARSYNDNAFLQKEIGSRLLDNLDFMAIDPEVVLDLGAGTGLCGTELLKRYQNSQIVSADFSIGMLQQVPQPWFRKKSACLCADAEAIPLTDDCIDLVFSNLLLHWCDPLLSCLKEIKRTMSGGGLFLFSTFGPDTIVELRKVWKEVNGEDDLHEFVDMHDIGDALIEAGFSEPVMEMEKLTVNYANVMKLMKDIESIVASESLQKYQQKQGLHTMENMYQKTYANEDGLPATFEVIYGHAWLNQRDRGGSIQPDIKITSVGKYVG